MYFYRMGGGVVALCYVSCIVGFWSLELGRCSLYLGFRLRAFYIYEGVVCILGFVSFGLVYLADLGYLVCSIVVQVSTYMGGREVLFLLWRPINSRGRRCVVPKSFFYCFRAL